MCTCMLTASEVTYYLLLGIFGMCASMNWNTKCICLVEVYACKGLFSEKQVLKIFCLQKVVQVESSTPAPVAPSAGGSTDGKFMLLFVSQNYFCESGITRWDGRHGMV